jgi:hypothetical protein
MRTALRVATFLALIALSVTAAAAQTPALERTLQLSFDADGNVNLAARNVTVREVLAEWARQCGCYIVNADRLPGGPMPMLIQFEHQPQGLVLESLLRQAAGYALTPQRAESRSISNFETIYILATSSPTQGAYIPPPSAPVMSMPTPGSPDDEIPPVIPQGPQGVPRPEFPPPGTMPGNLPVPSSAPAPTSRPGGTPTTFVPIVPVGTPQSSAPAPGSVTPALPPTPMPGR